MMIRIIGQAILWIWFFGCIVTYKVKNSLLVEGMGIKSAEFGMLVFYSIGIVLQLFFPWGNRYQLVILILWLVIQFMCHWRYTIFGATQKKIAGYNQCFDGTVKLFPPSDSRLIPDLYHIVLHLFIITNIVLLLVIR